jgi:hypothetical protein
VLAIAHGRSVPAAPWAWLALGAAFFADASATLLRRLARGAAPQQPHRTHAYQWLARRWHGHLPVTLSLLLLNLLVSLPLAAWSLGSPAHALTGAALAVGVWLVLALVAGGRVDLRLYRLEKAPSARPPRGLRLGEPIWRLRADPG